MIGTLNQLNIYVVYKYHQNLINGQPLKQELIAVSSSSSFMCTMSIFYSSQEEIKQSIQQYTLKERLLVKDREVHLTP